MSGVRGAGAWFQTGFCLENMGSEIAFIGFLLGFYYLSKRNFGLTNLFSLLGILPGIGMGVVRQAVREIKLETYPSLPEDKNGS